MACWLSGTWCLFLLSFVLVSAAQIGGALVGPHALNIISDVHAVQHLAELGVVFLLFNIGLELSLERLQSMAKYVFGMGAAQVGLTVLGVALFAIQFAGLPGPSAIILGGALAMSTTAVAIQVLEDRGEMGSRCGAMSERLGRSGTQVERMECWDAGRVTVGRGARPMQPAVLLLSTELGSSL